MTLRETNPAIEGLPQEAVAEIPAETLATLVEIGEEVNSTLDRTACWRRPRSWSAG